MSNHKAHPLGGKLVSWPVLVPGRDRTLLMKFEQADRL